MVVLLVTGLSPGRQSLLGLPISSVAYASDAPAPQADPLAGADVESDDEDDFDVGDAEKRMEKVVREQGRLTKKGGKMVSSGVGEFQIAGGYDLEKLAQGMRT